MPPARVRAAVLNIYGHAASRGRRLHAGAEPPARDGLTPHIKKEVHDMTEHPIPAGSRVVG
jgi:hypothetical protein